MAAESANNAMVGPSLVPLLTLSIPGSPTAAVLLGGLLIHGIFPGSDIFDKHPEVVWTFINSMLIGQVLMVIFGIMIAGWAAHIATCAGAHHGRRGAGAGTVRILLGPASRWVMSTSCWRWGSACSSWKNSASPLHRWCWALSWVRLPGTISPRA